MDTELYHCHRTRLHKQLWLFLDWTGPKSDELYLNRLGTNRLIHSLIKFTALSLNWHFPQLEPAQCPNLAFHNPVPDSVGQAGAGSVSSIESLTHVKSSVSPISVGAALSTIFQSWFLIKLIIIIHRFYTVTLIHVISLQPLTLF